MAHWKLDRAELACLLSKRRNTVDHWLSEKSPLRPPADVLRRLDELHLLFLQWQLEDQIAPHLRQLYETLRDRKGGS
jgi:hypothetical protein